MKKAVIILFLLIFAWTCTKAPQSFRISEYTKSTLLEQLKQYRAKLPTLRGSGTGQIIGKISGELEIYAVFVEMKDNFMNDGYKSEDFDKTQYGSWLSEFNKWVVNGRITSELDKLIRAAKGFQAKK